MRRQQQRRREWFQHWFNSHFYPLVYQHRDQAEAAVAVQLFLETCPLPPGAKILDLCCGTGRHAIPLAQAGFNVTGLDISTTLLQYAQRQGATLPNLRLVQQDMRLPFPDAPYDAILNLFTSFGYFETSNEDLQVLKNVAAALRPGGIFFFDYLNVPYTLRTLRHRDERVIANLHIIQTRSVNGKWLRKTIHIRDSEGAHHQFEERVRLYTLSDFQQLFAAVDLHIRRTFGDYDGTPYHPERSPRVIIVAQKNTSAEATRVDRSKHNADSQEH